MDYKELCRSVLKKDAYLSVNKKLAKLFGLEEAAFIADLLSKEEYFEEKEMLDDQGFFWNTQEDIKLSTNIPYHHQTEILKTLKGNNILTVVSKGIPAKNHFKINHEVIIRLLAQVIKPSCDKGKRLLMTINKNKNKPKEIISSKEDNKEDKPPYMDSSPSDKLIKVTHRRNKPLLETKRTLPKIFDPIINTKKIPKVSSDVQEILDYWKEQKLHVCNPITKEHKKGVEKIKGLLNGEKFGEVYSIEDIKLSISRFAQATYDDSVYPESKKTYKTLSISPFIKSKFLGKNDKDSLFLRYLREDPKPIKKLYQVRPNNHPALTEAIKDKYRKEVLNDSRYIPNDQDEDKFREAADKLEVYWIERKDVIRPMFNFGTIDKARLLFDAILHDVKDVSKISPGYFCSYVTFSRRLSAYLNKQVILDPPPDETFSIYDNSPKASRRNQYCDEDVILPGH